MRLPSFFIAFFALLIANFPSPTHATNHDAESKAAAETAFNGVWGGKWEVWTRGGRIKFSLTVLENGKLTGTVMEVTGEDHAFSTDIVGTVRGNKIKIPDLAGHYFDGKLTEGRITGSYCGDSCGSLNVRKLTEG